MSVLIQLTLDGFNPRELLRCQECGVEDYLRLESVLPPSGGLLFFVGDGPKEWKCSPCANLVCHWFCAKCACSNLEGSNFCRQCRARRPDPRPYVPDWDLIGKEMEEGRRETEALMAECDREYPGWRSVSLRRGERL